ncbi:MAG: hypothetical protein V5A34_08010 [Halapricum sp.]
MASFPAGRWSLLIVGLVIVIAGVAAGVAGPAPTTSTQTEDARSLQTTLSQINGTVNYLRVPDEDVRTTGVHRASVDVTASTRMSGDRLELQLALETFRTRFRNANTEAERTAAIREIVHSLDNHTAALNEQRERALDRYNDGEITANEFIAVLTRVDATAERIETTVGSVIDTTETTLDYSIPPELDTKLRNYEAQMFPNRGLIRRVEFRPAITGSGPSRQTYVETGDEAVVLATIVNDRYVREAFSSDALADEGDPQLRTSQDAIDRAAVLYPWAMSEENQKRSPRPDSFRNASAFSVDVSHLKGELTLYLDAVSADVFKERQTRDITVATTTATFTNSTGEFALTVNATHDTGPLGISLIRRTTNEGVNASVAVDERTVGTTGSDGHLWTLDTRGTTSIEVTTVDGETFTVQIPKEALPD